MAASVFSIGAVVALFAHVLSVTADDVVVELASGGQLKGVTKQFNSGQMVDVFYEIPYAQPPTGDQRFQPPTPAAPWTGVRDASKPGVICPQKPGEIMFERRSENCLYLNVFTPDVNGSLPVMVWIHGGGYRTGSYFNDGDGSTLAPHGIVVVAINYRLGPFGFLSTGDDVMPGNYGMLDQVLALKWVQQNIKVFGGDPGQVTIAGESAGAFSVGLLVVSPLAKGLFKRAIMESGCSLSGAAIERPGSLYKIKDYTFRVAELVGCNHTTSSEVFACLQNADTESLLIAAVDVGKSMGSDTIAIPRVETKFGFLPDYPKNILDSKNINAVDTLRGYNSGEMSWPVQDPDDNGITRDEFSRYFRGVLKVVSYVNNDAIQKIVEEMYLSDETDPFKLRANLVTALSDMAFGASEYLELNKTIAALGNSKNHYFYQFFYLDSHNKNPAWLGVPHAAERPYVFYNPDSTTMSDTDKKVGAGVQKMWVNFVKYGDPTPAGQSDGLVPWSKYEDESSSILNIDANVSLVLMPRPGVSALYQRVLNLMHVTSVIDNTDPIIGYSVSETYDINFRSGKMATSLVVLVLTFVVVVMRPVLARGEDIVVQLNHGGKLRGVTKQFNSGREVQVFYEIPYARPPTGDLRFEPPTPAAPWTGVRDASKPGVICPQKPGEIMLKRRSEDCLYLNVFTPDVNGSLPVMVWIHGGSYKTGSYFSDGNGTTLARLGVVYVAINYRLVPFGFLSTGDDVMPGNYGMLDQVLALKWVQQNIKVFGGDPGQVTIAGVSAGAFSVGLLVVSPLAKGLFKRAIMESGCSLSGAAIERPGSSIKARDFTLNVASRVGCNVSSSLDILACLKRSDNLLIAASNAGGDIGQQLIAVPRVETKFGFLPDYPENLLDSKDFNAVDTLRGYNSGEMSRLVRDAENDGITRSEFSRYFRGIRRLASFVNNDAIQKLVEEMYIANATKPYELRSNLVSAIADMSFGACQFLELNKTLSVLGDLRNHFFYKFHYQDSRNKQGSWYEVPHASELRFVFYNPDATYMSDSDRKVGASVQRMWVNFVKYGDPTPAGHSNSLVTWKKFTGDSRLVMRIDSNSRLIQMPRPGVVSLYQRVLNLMNLRTLSATDVFFVQVHIQTFFFIHIHIFDTRCLKHITSVSRVGKMAASLVSLVLTFVVVVMRAVVARGEDIVVQLNHGGKLRGVTKQFNSGREVQVFYEIPYARPPTGNLRFEPPTPAGPWSGTRDASEPGVICPQFPGEKMSEGRSEDCLYLNVFTPDVNGSLPVMVWIHGGSYKTGSYFSDGNGATLARLGVVYVAINYRLVPFGFLSTGDDVMPGNYGMLDQVLALRWVQQNIKVFGGDPGQVTIAGESAGGFSVGLLVVSPLAKGLFKRAIMESGCSLSSPAIERPGSLFKVKDFTYRIAAELGCGKRNSSSLLACLKSADARRLLFAASEVGNNLPTNVIAAPRVETKFGFLPDYPENLLDSRDFNAVDTLRGYNSGEMSWLVEDDEDDGITRSEFRRYFRGIRRLASFVNNDAMQRVVEELYLDDETDPYQLRSNLVSALADISFGASEFLELNKTLAATGDANNHFFYKFHYMHSGNKKPAWYGVIHAAERRFVFYNPDATYMSDRDRKVGASVQRMWVNFVKYGDPTPAGHSNSLVTWKKFTGDSRLVMRIDSNSRLIQMPRPGVVSLYQRVLNLMNLRTVVGKRT
ncbi:uncharacterized protein LOC131958336 [Physella acuta]|uniref:uncharacterized protein LOC131958336 n=1 Tax=Physella acuta TaxID=109671 RepID=UPI0027DE70DB|nr:uncharacterized protein LOC131958336 [Physella acuta]